MHVNLLPREVKSSNLLQITLCSNKKAGTNYISTLTSPSLALFCINVHVIVITCEGTGIYILSDFFKFLALRKFLEKIKIFKIQILNRRC